MEPLSIRFILLHLVAAVGTWIALFLMNELDTNQRMARWKIALCIVAHYFLSLTLNFLVKNTHFTMLELAAIPMMLLGLLICCILFTGGVVKIFLSILITDLWGGMNELLASFLYCLITQRKLEMIYIYELDGDVFLQFLFEILLWAVMIFLTRPLFLKFRRLPILDRKLFAFLFVGYFCLGSFLRVSPTSFFDGTVARYRNTLTFMVCYSCIFIFFLGYNRKNLIQAEIQSLYLKQKLQDEYGLVFQDMEKSIQCFRHDVRKHMDALDYLEENCSLEVPQEQLQQYRSNLNAIYQELVRGNYCNTMDINVVLMQLDKQVKEASADFSVSLKNLETDSLPVYIRMQLFEKISNWIQKRIAEADNEAGESRSNHEPAYLQSVSINGITHAGYHTLKFTIRFEEPDSSHRNGSRLIRQFRQKKAEIKMKQEIKKLLHKYNGTCRIEKLKIPENTAWNQNKPGKNAPEETISEKNILEITLTAGWHGER